MAEQLRVKVVIDTEQLTIWAAKHRELGHESVATALAAAAHHYERIDPAAYPDDPPRPVYPAGLDAAELRTWANWHVDRRGSVGVAHVLYEAAGLIEGFAESDAADKLR